MTLKKIISSGQTEVERAALDVALKMDIPCGGWAPSARSAADGSRLKKYQLQETPAAGYTELAEKNVLESDGVLIISIGRLTGGAEVSRKLALISRRLLLHIDRYTTPARQAVSIISSWLRLNSVERLYVTGPETIKDPDVYHDTMYLLENALWVNRIKNIVDEFWDSPLAAGRVVEDVVCRMMSEMSLKQKVGIANLKTPEIETLQYALDLYISSRRETAENSGMKKTGLYTDGEDTGIVKILWQKLHQTHKLRAVK